MIATIPKLKVGSVIKVRGWVMLEKLDDGCSYIVSSMPDFHGIPTYQFKKVRGKKFVTRHPVDSVDPWVNNDSNDLNGIEIVAPKD
jgi:hypothetical protein